MRIFGEICLLMAFVGSGYSSFACLCSLRDRWTGLGRAGIVAAWVTLISLSCTIGVLAWALLAKDFSFEYVAHYSSQLLPRHYSVSALWVGQAGSLLLWTWILVLLSFVFLATVPRGHRLRLPSYGIVMANVWFLVLIMVFAADPMKASISSRRDGLGLSPLLQHPSMLIHPPVIFLGYAAWAVPFAVAVSALITRELDATWTRLARPWALFAWTALGAGLLLGAHWAYQELGWGGYWGWDPVENGSLIPWLTGTAFIHCLIAWRQRGSLKKMAVTLAIATFGLCNFATFLTRSGIFSSVHAFSQSPIGWMFLGLMAVLWIGGGTLVYLRRHQLSPDRPIGSVFARESLILGSTYLLLLFAAVVIAGTLYTPVSMVVVGRMVQIGPAFYNNVFMPIGISLFAATAIVPLVRWGKRPQRFERQALLACSLVGAAGAAIAAWLGARHPAVWTVAGLAVLIAATTIVELVRDVLRQRAGNRFAAISLTLKNHRRRYAAYGIHLGLACIAIGITGSSLGTRRQDVQLNEGQVIEWEQRRIEYVKLVQREDNDKLVAEVELRISKGDSSPVTLMPARHFHLLQNQWTTEVSIHSTWGEDFYTILNAGLGEGRVDLTFVKNPLMRWIWFGGWLSGGGVLVAAWPQRRRHSAERNRNVDRLPHPNRARDHERRAA